MDLSRVEIAEFDFCMLGDDDVLSVVGAIPGIQRLLLPGARGLTKERLARLVQSVNSTKQAPVLYSLDVSASDIPPGSMSILAGIPSLTNLTLDKTRLNDEDMKALMSLRVGSMTIESTDVTDKGLLYLAEIPSLYRIHVDNNPGITASGLSEFKNHSDCEVGNWTNLRSARSKAAIDELQQSLGYTLDSPARGQLKEQLQRKAP